MDDMELTVDLSGMELNYISEPTLRLVDFITRQLLTVLIPEAAPPEDPSQKLAVKKKKVEKEPEEPGFLKMSVIITHHLNHHI